MKKHRVGIIITTYNRAHYLRESVESVLSQTFDDWQLLICDDASTDATQALCAEFCQRDERVRVLRHPANVGMVSNARLGFNASGGELFARLDDDNLWLPTFLECTVALLDATPEAAFAFSDEWFMQENGQRDLESTEKWGQQYGRTSLLPGLQADSASVIVQQSTSINVSLFRRAAVEEVGGFSPQLSAGLDYDLFLKIAHAGHKCAYVPERLGQYRLHPAQSTSNRVHHVKKAQDIVNMLEACRFTGRAEKLRLKVLSGAYLALGRTLLLGSQVPEARAAITQARRLRPLQMRPHLIWLMLTMPKPVRQQLIDRRY